MKFQQMYPSRFLKADDFPTPFVAHVRLVQMEKLGSDGGDDRPVQYFEELEKALVLNKTNAVAMVNITGSEDSDNWVGAAVELYRDSVLFRGQRTACVRVRAPRAQQPAAKADYDDSEDIPDSWNDEPIITPRRKKST